jgi:hypothetical protein
LFNLADAASFLWRWRLYRERPSLDRRWDEVTALARRHFPRAGLHFAQRLARRPSRRDREWLALPAQHSRRQTEAAP